MIAAWMLWSAGIGLLFFVAGLATERLLTLGGRQTRWVWVTAGVATSFCRGCGCWAGVRAGRSHRRQSRRPCWSRWR